LRSAACDAASCLGDGDHVVRSTLNGVRAAMRTPRDWGDDEAGCVPDGGREVRVMVRGLGLAAAVLTALVAGWSAWSRFSATRVPVDRAREMLRVSLGGPPHERGPRAERAATSLRSHAWRRGPHADSARLLLAVAALLRARADADAPVAWQMEFEDLLDTIRPAACGIEDLRLAIDAFVRSGQRAEADWLMETALARRGELTIERQRELLLLAANLRYDLGLEQAVLDHGEQLAALAPADPEPWRLMAMVHEDRGHHERHVQMLEQVVERDPLNSLGERLRITESLVALGDAPRAREQYEHLAATAPDLLVRHPLVEARLILMEGDPERATTLVADVLEREPNNAEASLLRAKLHLGQGEFAPAAELLERITQSSPMHPEAHFLAGQAHGRLGDRVRSESHLRLHERILDTRVRLHRLERVAGRNPGDRETRSEIVRLYRDLGLHEQADFWQRALESTR